MKEAYVVDIKIKNWPEFVRLLQPSDYLFPENEYKFRSIPEGLFKHLQRRAAQLLKDFPNASAAHKAFWLDLVAGKPPYELLIEKKTRKGLVYEKHSSRTDS